MLYNCLYIMAMAAPANAGEQPNPKAQMLQMLMMMAFFILFMWLFLFRPQQKKAKEHRQMLSTLKVGDKIVTSTGIIGVIVSVKDQSLSIRSGDSKLEITQSAVANVLERGKSEA